VIKTPRQAQEIHKLARTNVQPKILCHKALELLSDAEERRRVDFWVLSSWDPEVSPGRYAGGCSSTGSTNWSGTEAFTPEQEIENLDQPSPTLSFELVASGRRRTDEDQEPIEIFIMLLQWAEVVFFEEPDELGSLEIVSISSSDHDKIAPPTIVCK